MNDEDSCLYGVSLTTTDVIEICFTSCGLVAILCICIHSSQSDWKSRPIKALFFLSMTVAALFLAIVLILTMNCMYPSPIPTWLSDTLSSLGILSYMALSQSLLCTLIIRLVLAFEDSAFRVSLTMQRAFGVLYVAMTLCDIVWLYFSVKDAVTGLGWHEESVLVSWSLFWALWFGTSVMAVAVFVRNLYRLATLQPPENLSADQSIQLTHRQNELVRVSSKYISLFTFAAVSTLLMVLTATTRRIWSWSVQSLGELDANQFSLVVAVDVMVNAVCLYLQYKF